MKNIKIIQIVNILLSLFLGGLLIFGGINKFKEPSPSPKSQIESYQKGEMNHPEAEPRGI